MSQAGWQITLIHILPIISRSTGNQTMSFCQAIEYKKRNIFFKNKVENETERLVPGLRVLKKLYMR